VGEDYELDLEVGIVYENARDHYVNVLAPHEDGPEVDSPLVAGQVDALVHVFVGKAHGGRVELFAVVFQHI